MQIDDEERRRRLVQRHRLGLPAADPLEVARSVVAIHSSDPVTPYLAAWARVEGFETTDLDDHLLERRTILRMHAMRRTLFVVPADEAGIFEAGAARQVAAKERQRLLGWLTPELGADGLDGWLDSMTARVVELLAQGEYRTQDVVAELPEIARTITVGSGKWATSTPVSSRLLFLLAMEGRIVRTRAGGSWRSSQYMWTAARAWSDASKEIADPRHGRARLLGRYLASYGPATLTDIRWWTGWTARDSRTVLEDLDTTEVELAGGEVGHVLAGDVEDTPEAGGPTVALLPGLDSTPMGWKQRHWYLGDHGPELFDRNGNVGPTVWVDGRIVGGWGQRPDGTIAHRLLEPVEPPAGREIEAAAARLTAWMSGVVVTPRFRTPLERALAG